MLPDGLRPYQEQAVTKAIEHLRRVRSTIVVMPTGTGKTQVFVALTSIARGRVLMLAHRDELVSQAAARVKQMLGVTAEIEKAELRSDNGKIVVGSVQSLRGPRLERFSPDAFSLIVIDEAHHAVSPSYQAVTDHFSGAKVIGVTATPDRTDQKALGKVFDSIAFEYGIIDAINDGWLVEPIAEQVVLQAVNLADIRTTSGGDFNIGDLEGAIGVTKALHGIAQPLIKLAGERRTVIYTPGVSSAYGLSDILCEYRSDSARALDATTPVEERRAMLDDFDEDKFQFMVNCQILVEGWDSPGVSCVAIARPTKSRSLYAQMLGRGLRPFPGKIDCLVIDYTDVTRRHDLAGPEDALGGSLGDEVVAQAKAEREDGESLNVLEHLRKAQAEVKYKTNRERLIAQRKEKAKNGGARKLVPAEIAWPLFGLDPDEIERAARWGFKPATDAQIKQLLKDGIEPGEVTTTVARQMIQVMRERKEKRLASPAQLQLLSRYKKAFPDMTSDQAKAVINVIASRGWRK